MFKKIQSAINTPIRITIVVAIFSITITAVLSYIMSGSVAAYSLIIAAVCGTVLPYWTSTMAYGYQEDLAKKTVELEQLTSELQTSNVQLAASNADLNAYAHTVAHDLKNPLSVIMASSGLLLENHEAMTAEKSTRMLGMIANTSEKMAHIIDDLLLLSSLRDGDIKLEPMNMADAFSDARTRLQSMIEEKQAVIVVPETWPEANGYQPWIEAVWTNYLSNALKYGGEPPQIEVGGMGVDSGYVRFWIKNNGERLSSEEQERLFVPFERLSQSVSSIEGYGLGLSIVQRIIYKLKGQVGVESNGDGTTFFFTLPAT